MDAACGRCSVCMAEEPVKLISSALPSLDVQDFHTLVQPLTDMAGSPVPVALVTRFLCGISSPRLIEYKARQMAGFGRLEAKRMFGGAGLYHDGLMFAILDDDVVYFRVDDALEADLKAQGSVP